MNRVKLGFWEQQLLGSSDLADGQLEAWAGDGQGQPAARLPGWSLIRQPANGELREQVLNLVQQLSHLRGSVAIDEQFLYNLNVFIFALKEKFTQLQKPGLWSSGESGQPFPNNLMPQQGQQSLF